MAKIWTTVSCKTSKIRGVHFCRRGLRVRLNVIPLQVVLQDILINERYRLLVRSPEPLSVLPEALQAGLAQAASTSCTAYEPGHAALPDGTLRGTGLQETNGTSFADDMAKRRGHGWEHDPLPSAELYRKTCDVGCAMYLDNNECKQLFPCSPEAIRPRLQAKPANKSACKAAEPDQLKSILGSRNRAQSLRSFVSSPRVEAQQRPDSCYLFQHHDHGDGSNPTSEPERRHPPVPHDRGERNKECSTVPPEVQESGANTPMLPDHDGISELELGNAEPSIQSSVSQKHVKFRRDGGRRHRDAD